MKKRKPLFLNFPFVARVVLADQTESLLHQVDRPASQLVRSSSSSSSSKHDVTHIVPFFFTVMLARVMTELMMKKISVNQGYLAS